MNDLPARLARLKQALGLSWDALAACLGVDPRQLQRWRSGTLPNGFAMAALFLLADRIPGAELKVLEGQTHGFFWQDPELTNDVILSWVKRHS